VNDFFIGSGGLRWMSLNSDFGDTPPHISFGSSSVSLSQFWH
jgi:hypothetical protein